jgi:hypothetical protein
MAGLVRVLGFLKGRSTLVQRGDRHGDGGESRSWKGICDG